MFTNEVRDLFFRLFVRLKTALQCNASSSMSLFLALRALAPEDCGGMGIEEKEVTNGQGQLEWIPPPLS